MGKKRGGLSETENTGRGSIQSGWGSRINDNKAINVGFGVAVQNCGADTSGSQRLLGDVCITNFH